MRQALIIHVGGNRELSIAVNAALRSIGFVDPTPGNLAERDLLIWKGESQIHASYGEEGAIIVDAMHDSLDNILRAAKPFLSVPTTKMPFLLGGHSVIVTPGEKVKVGCVDVTREQLRKINEAFNSSHDQT